jgi:PAS domain S-box-containing protein
VGTETPRGSRLQTARRRAIVDASFDCIITIDAAGTILEFNRRAERAFRISAPDAIGRDMADLIIPENLRAAHRAGLARQVATGKGALLDQRVRTIAMSADGREFPIELAITRVDDEDGPPVFTAHLRDLTGRQRAEEEVRASRARLVEVADAERRKLERDLHDGAQQRLVALALDLTLARELIESDPKEAANALDGVVSGLHEAIDELRELARGMYPPMLAQRGLGPALKALVRRSRLPATLETDLDERLPAPVEATAYYVTAEGLTNAARYAPGAQVRIDLKRGLNEIFLEIADDGPGGARAGVGSGLGGLADRVAALGGELWIDSPPGAGTTIRARMPCV